MIGLRALDAALPDRVQPVEEFAYLAPLVPGLHVFPKRRRRDVREDAAERLAVDAAERALASAGLGPQDVDWIVCQAVGGRFIAPGIGSYVHRALGCRIETPVTNIQQVCAGFADGCRMAWDALRGDPAVSNVLVVNVAAWFTGGWGCDWSDPSAAVCGDGAVAGLVSRSAVALEFLSYVNRTHDEIYEDLIVQAVAPSNPDFPAPDLPRNKAVMIVRPSFPEWMMRTGKNLPVWLLHAAAEKAGLRVDQIDFIAPHQAQHSTLDLWMRTAETELGVAQPKWRHHWDEYGNMAGADAALNLAHLLHDGDLRQGNIVALFTPGGAGHSPTMLLRRTGASNGQT